MTPIEITSKIEELISEGKFKVSTLGGRLRLLAAANGVKDSPTEIGRWLEVSKQKAEKWLNGGAGEMRPSALFRVADKAGVSARWLADGKSSPVPETQLQPVHKQAIDYVDSMTHREFSEWFQHGDRILEEQDKPSRASPFKRRVTVPK